MRRAEAKIGVLREVIERVQRGEKGVDVEGLLGTGETAAEREWKSVLKEVEEEEVLFRSKKERRAERGREMGGVEGKGEGNKEEVGKVVEEDEKVRVETFKGARFY